MIPIIVISIITVRQIFKIEKYVVVGVKGKKKFKFWYT